MNIGDEACSGRAGVPCSMDYAKPLEEIERLTTTYSESSLSFGVVSKKAAAVLAEANNPGVKE